MRRRDFGKGFLGAAAVTSLSGFPRMVEGAVQPERAKRPHRKNLKMHVSTDYHVVEGKEFISKENFDYNLRFGVSHINPDPVMIAAGSGPPKLRPKPDGAISLRRRVRRRELSISTLSSGCGTHATPRESP